MKRSIRGKARTLALSALVAGGAVVVLPGCEAVEDALGEALGTMTVSGQVNDAQGNPVEGAQVKVYLFSKNTDHLGVPQDSGSNDPNSFKARVDLDSLIHEGQVAKTGTTNADGRYSIAGVAVNAVIVTATKDGWSTDIQGMNTTDGTVSLSTALAPPGNQVGTNDAKINADFVIVGPPSDDEAGPEPTPPPPTPDEDEIEPPVESAWKSFTVTDQDGNPLADMTDGNGSFGLDGGLAAGGVIRIAGEHTDTSLTKAYLRVQLGSSQCEDDALEAKADMIQVKLENGKIVSDAGEFQKWYLTGGYEQIQLDLDQEAGNGNESYLVTIDELCKQPSSAMTVTLTWDTDGVDADMHLWEKETEEHTFYASRYDGQPRSSSYGSIDIDDRDGHGPEVFTLNPDKSGTFSSRIHFFSGQSSTPTNVRVRVVRYADGKWHDQTFEGPLPNRDWFDVGSFEVDPLP